MLFIIAFVFVFIVICLGLMDWQFFWDIFKWGLLVVFALFILGCLGLLLCFLGFMMAGKAIFG